jgi:hypothetical protein
LITQGPFTLTLGDTLPLNDPGATSNNPATAVQIQNASPFIIEVNSGGTVLTIQSFTAQTVLTSGGGQQMSVTPLASGGSAQTTAVDGLTVVWLLAGESAPMVDGPLTAAALASTLASSGLSGASGSVKGISIAVAAGATDPMTVPVGNLKIWNLGWFKQALGTLPTIGQATFTFPGPSFTGGIDSVTVAAAGSDRLAGLIFTGNPEITNNMDQAIDAFLVYSPT